METTASWLWWIPALPLLGSIACGALHFSTLRARRTHGESAGPGRFAPLVAVAAVAASFVVSCVGFQALLPATGRTLLESGAWSWIDAGIVRIDVSMVLDRLSSVMTLVVTGVGLLIHVYAAGYMKGDPGYARFFAYLNLFVALMLVLVLSSDLVGLFVGWEGVGLCSYLLIGFWYERTWPAEAAQKAFVVNRIGDAAFLLGTFLLVGILGTLDISSINAAVAGADESRSAGLALAALLLFGGACGKSAQIPLFTWLPDAMAGPTPVSALIHAATMVTSGIYLVVRLNPLFASAPSVLLTIGIVGAFTALLAGSTALVQRDLKKVLAYSTVSQLGYMFLALGTGAWVAAMFHLVTHAFFKALLFLGAGSVIHGMHDEQDMHRTGGLRTAMPRTFVTFVAGAAALSGLPLLSGFFSKDEILAHVFGHGGAWRLLWFIGIVTAAMTAFYSWRMVALVFFGPRRFDPNRVHPHESPPILTVPLLILALLAIGGGVLGLPAVLGAPHYLRDWLAPVVEEGDRILAGRQGTAHLAHWIEWTLLGLGSVIALLFAHAGFHANRRGTVGDERLAAERPRLARFLGEAWGVDRGYSAWVVRPVKLASFVVAVAVDQLAIDGAVNGAASGARRLGARLRGMADGSIASYGLWMGAASAILALLWIWTGAR